MGRDEQPIWVRVFMYTVYIVFPKQKKEFAPAPALILQLHRCYIIDPFLWLKFRIVTCQIWKKNGWEVEWRKSMQENCFFNKSKHFTNMN